MKQLAQWKLVYAPAMLHTDDSVEQKTAQQETGVQLSAGRKP